MARILDEGFGGGDGLFWSSSFGASSVLNPRSGSDLRSWSVNNDVKILPSTYTEFYFRWAHRFTTANLAGTLMEFRSGVTTSVIRVQRSADNTVQLLSNAGAFTLFTTTPIAVIRAGQWILFELHIKIGGAGVGVTTLKVDGIQRGTNTTDANNQNGSSIDRFAFIAVGTEQIDDLAFNDTTTGSDNSWPGDGHMLYLSPNAAGASTQFSVFGAGANYQAVNEVPPDGDTTYVYTSSTGQRDAYNLADSGLGSVTISRVRTEMVSRIDVADASTIGMYIRTGGVNYDDANGLLAQTLSYDRYKSAEWLTNPNTTNPWTVSDVDGLQAGVRT